MSEPQLPEQPPGSATQPQPVPPQQRPPTGAPVSGPPGGELVHYPPDKRAVLPTKDPKGRKLPLRTVLIIVAGVVAVLCLGGLGTGYFLYRGASEPERSTPGVTLRQYLEAKLNDRDDSRASQFSCRGDGDLAQLDALRSDLKAKESQFNVSIRSAPEGFETTQSGKNATVGAKLRLSVSSGQSFQEQIQSWRFQLRDQSGWRVCGAERLS